MYVKHVHLSPTDGIPALMYWRGLHVQRILRSMPAGVLLLAGSTMLGHPGPPSWGLGVRETTSHRKKKVCIEKTSNMIQIGQVNRRWPGYNKENLIFGTWNI
jgi:hypothetical protein